LQQLPTITPRDLYQRLTKSTTTALQSCRALAVKTFSAKLERFYQYPPIPLALPRHYQPIKLPSIIQLPIVSIVTPTYNHGRFLEYTIQSVLEQDYPHIEYVIQDGDSTDDTATVLNRYRSRVAFIESCKDNGQANAINRGFSRCTGQIMAWLNSDDLLLPGAVAYVVKFFIDHPSVDAVYGHRIIIDENNQEVGRIVLPPHDERAMLWCDYAPQETLFWRKRIWDKVGALVDESFHFAIDWDLLLRFQQAKAKIIRLPRFLGAFRAHPAQKTAAAIHDIGMKEMARLRTRAHGREVTFQEIIKNIRWYRYQHIVYDKLYHLGLLKY
jgi:glycosyltransferase involved in cell wall biosynthesis